jgi:hypothetical protein
VFIGIKSNGFYDVINNLHGLAVAQNLNSNYYIWFINDSNSLRLIALLFISVVGLNILYNKVGVMKATRIHFSSMLFKLLLIFAVVWLGVCAIGTKANSMNIQGKQIITYNAQLANGEMGYVVKTIDKNHQNAIEMGILPLLINDNNTQVESDAYNYLLSGVITLEHYLPEQMRFLIIIGVIALFIASISQYLLHSSRIIVKNATSSLN